VSDFAVELRRLHVAAGSPPAHKLISAGAKARPAVALTPQSISEWLNGRSTPATPAPWLFLVEHLTKVACERGSYSPVPPGRWKILYDRARDRKRAADPPRRPRLQTGFDSLLHRHTALFAGRQAELARITEFVRSGQHGYVFVEALSGYGKTSLIAQLVAGNPGYAYHFISQAYRVTGSPFDPTAEITVLENLCEQLGAEPLPYGDVWALRTTFAQLLLRPTPTPTVLVIDAIDEIERHPSFLRTLLPRPLPEGYIVVLSARTQGDRSYLMDVGLSRADVGLHLVLDGFDEDTIGELLLLAGGSAARYGKRSRFVAELRRVSGGDPFYLRFLVEDIAAGLLDETNVVATPEGLEGYLDQQLTQLNRSAHERQHRDILGLILDAQGALSRSDLIRMVPGVDGLNFDDVVRDIHRFLLVHDGQYTLCHGRFKDYFAGRA
jgi:hypothetical protein